MRRKCISYLTIEHRGPIAPELMEGMGRQVFGCDICQDVCPWNRKAPIGADPELEARAELVNPALEWLAAMDEAEFEREFNGSPVRRAGFLGLKRNVAIAMGNSGLAVCAVAGKWAEAADEGLREAARWALEKLKAESSGLERQNWMAGWPPGPAVGGTLPQLSLIETALPSALSNRAFLRDSAKFCSERRSSKWLMN
jgi:hypothetical protein